MKWPIGMVNLQNALLTPVLCMYRVEISSKSSGLMGELCRGVHERVC